MVTGRFVPYRSDRENTGSGTGTGTAKRLGSEGSAAGQSGSVGTN